MVAEPSRHVVWMGLAIRDPEGYRRYRAEMTPLLHAAGGSFGHDFVVSDVLQSEVSHAIHRVFTLCFPSREAYEAFFHRPDYQAIRTRYFEPSVVHSSRLGAYDEVM